MVRFSTVKNVVVSVIDMPVVSFTAIVHNAMLYSAADVPLPAITPLLVVN